MLETLVFDFPIAGSKADDTHALVHKVCKFFIGLGLAGIEVASVSAVQEPCKSTAYPSLLPRAQKCKAFWEAHECRATLPCCRSVVWQHFSIFYATSIQTVYNQKTHRLVLKIIDPIIVS